MYGGNGYGYAYRGPQTATFDAPTTKNGQYNEDALPAMPSWDHATSKHVEEQDVEMEKLDGIAGQQEALLSDNGNSGGRYYTNQAQDPAGDLGAMQTGPYHDYDQHQQFVGSPIATRANSTYPPTYHTRPQPSGYDAPSANPYAPSIPPSYRTAAPSVASPVQQSHPASLGVGRKPVQGTWRDV